MASTQKRHISRQNCPIYNIYEQKKKRKKGKVRAPWPNSDHWPIQLHKTPASYSCQAIKHLVHKINILGTLWPNIIYVCLYSYYCGYDWTRWLAGCAHVAFHHFLSGAGPIYYDNFQSLGPVSMAVHPSIDVTHTARCHCDSQRTKIDDIRL